MIWTILQECTTTFDGKAHFTDTFLLSPESKVVLIIAHCAASAFTQVVDLNASSPSSPNSCVSITQLLLSGFQRHHINERSLPPVTLGSVLAVSKKPVASWGKNTLHMKATARHAKPLISPRRCKQPAITSASGSANSVMGNPLLTPILNTHTHIHTRTYSHLVLLCSHITAVKKRRHSEDTPGTLFFSLFFQTGICVSRRRSVIINTMTVWVYTNCHSGKRLPSGETASLFLRLIYIADDNAPAFQLEGNKAVIWS